MSCTPIVAVQWRNSQPWLLPCRRLSLLASPCSSATNQRKPPPLCAWCSRWKSTMNAAMAICVPSVICARKSAISASTALPNSQCCLRAARQATEGYHLGLCIPRPQLCTLDMPFHIDAAGRRTPKDFLPDFLTLHAQIEPGVCGVAPYPGEHFRVHLGT